MENMAYIKVEGKVYDYAEWEDKIKYEWKEKMRKEKND